MRNVIDVLVVQESSGLSCSGTAQSLLHVSQPCQALPCVPPALAQAEPSPFLGVPPSLPGLPVPLATRGCWHLQGNSFVLLSALTEQLDWVQLLGLFHLC